jgi:hypothetical protein
MFKRIAAVGFVLLLAFGARAETLSSVTSSHLKDQPEQSSRTRDLLTDAAIVAILVAASISAYKARGGPCACPDDRMSNGRRCGGNSAWSRSGGYEPFCFPTDITAAMIRAYREHKEIPGLR